MHYEIRGQGEPLVLVHGLGTGSADWQFQFPALEPHYRVIAPCLRGFGRSERFSGDYSIELFADDLAALLDELGLPDCHLCGVSMGGAVAYQFAVGHPQRLRSLVTINSQPTFELNSPKKLLFYYQRAWLVRLLGLQAVARRQALRNFPGAANAALRRQLEGRFDNDPDIYLAALGSLKHWTVVDSLDSIAAPALVIAAEHDYSTPEEKRRLVRRMPDVRVQVIEGAHHAVHLEMPQAVNKAILDFLGALDTRSPDVSHSVAGSDG